MSPGLGEQSVRFALVCHDNAGMGDFDADELREALRAISRDHQLTVVETAEGPERVYADSTQMGFERVLNRFERGKLHNLLEREVKEVRRLRLVLLLHGIRTHAEWQERIRNLLRDEFTSVVPIGYGRLDFIRFWLPLPTRRKPIRTVLQKLEAAIKLNRGQNRELVVIAHSFGTYALVRILDENSTIRPDRILLCGSIVRDVFPWTDLQNRPSEILNEAGSRDIWPVLARSTTWGYGSTGTFGFKTPGVRDRLHDLGHSDYFKGDFAEEFWLPWVREGRYEKSEFEDSRPTTPWFKSFLEISPLRWIQPILGVLLIWALATSAGLTEPRFLSALLPNVLRPFGAIGKVDLLYPFLIVVLALAMFFGLSVLRREPPGRAPVRLIVQLVFGLLFIVVVGVVLVEAAERSGARLAEDFKVQSDNAGLRFLSQSLSPAVGDEAERTDADWRLDLGSPLRASLARASERIPLYASLGVEEVSTVASLAGRYAFYAGDDGDDIAGRLFESAVRLEGTPGQLNDLGVQRWRSGDLDEAEKYFLKARELDPKFNNPLNGLGLVAFSRARKRGDDPSLLAQAVERFEEALAADSEYGKAYNNLGLANRRLGLIQESPEEAATYFAEAEKNFLRAKELLPESADACFNLGLLSYERGNYAGAIEFYQAALERDPDYSKALNNLAWMYTTTQGFLRPALALEHARRAVELAPGNPGNLDTLARALYALDHKKEALAVARRAYAAARESNRPYAGEIEEFLRTIESELGSSTEADRTRSKVPAH